MNRTLHYRADSCDPRFTNRTQLFFCREMGVETTISQWIEAAFDPSNECSKCPWSHYLTFTRKVVVHTLRCHFNITTKLSKNTLPTRFSNWRNHDFTSRSEACQRLLGINLKIFSNYSRVDFCRLTGRVAPVWIDHRNRVCIISAADPAATHPKNESVSFGLIRRNTLHHSRLQPASHSKPPQSLSEMPQKLHRDGTRSCRCGDLSTKLRP
jgi:hypothetical protein